MFVSLTFYLIEAVLCTLVCLPAMAVTSAAEGPDREDTPFPTALNQEVPAAGGYPSIDWADSDHPGALQEQEAWSPLDREIHAERDRDFSARGYTS